jgi:Icc-related predicted phosphoesterase
MEDINNNIRIAAVADIHVRVGDKGKWTDLFKEASLKADVLLLCGDLTDTGDEQEAELLAEELRSCAIPVIAVLGNHDHEKGRHKLIRQIMQQAGVNMLDGECAVIKGVGFAGVKGFGGGFGHHLLSMFGELEMKAFVQEAVDQSLSLDRALARLDQEHDNIKKIAVLHYAPMAATIAGEPKEIFPFLGSSRLAEPLIRRQVIAAFHGHAHAGTLEGTLDNDVKVFNVARPILIKAGYTPPLFFYDV